MKKSLFRGSLFWLLLYLCVMTAAALAYVNNRHISKPFELSGVSSLLTKDSEVGISFSGEGLDQEFTGHLVLDAANNRAIVGNIPLWGNIVDIEIVDDQAYLTSLNEDVKIFDLKNPTLPVSNGRFNGRVGGWRIAAVDELIYVSSMNAGISVFNRQSRDKTQQIFHVGTAIKTVHRDQYLFVASGLKGLSILDVADSGSARVAGKLSLPGLTSDLTFLDDFLVVASQAGGLHLIDIIDPENPILLQTIKARKKYTSVTTVDGYVYASDADMKLDIFGLSETHLKYLANIPLFGPVRDYLKDGENLYFSESNYGVSRLDISDPVHPKRNGYVGFTVEVKGLALFDNYLYTASGLQGVQIIDTRRFQPRTVLASIDTPGRAIDIELDGRWIYVADKEGGLRVIDRSDLKNLKIVAHLPTRYKVIALARKQNILFLVLENKGLLVVDVSNPLSPKRLKHFDVGVPFSDLAIQGTDLFAVSYEKKLLKIDIADPTLPKVIETLDLPWRAKRLALSGDNVFIAAEKAGLVVARFAPDQPGRLIANMTRPWPMNEYLQTFGIAVRGNYAYVVQGGEGLQIVDISQPDKPKEVALVSLPGPVLTVHLSTSYAIVSSRRDGFAFVDITRPESAYLAAQLYLPRVTKNFRVEADSLYATGQTSGISVVPLPIKNSNSYDPSDPSLIFKDPRLAGWYDLNISNGDNFKTVSAVVEVN